MKKALGALVIIFCTSHLCSAAERETPALPAELEAYIAKLSFKQALDFWLTKALEYAPSIILVHPFLPMIEAPFGWISSVTNDYLLSKYGTDLYLWQINTGTILRTFSFERDTIIDQTLSPDGRILALAYFNGTLQLISTENNAVLQTIQFPDKFVPTMLAFNGAGNLLAAADRERIFLWDSKKKSHGFWPYEENYIDAIALDYSGDYIAIYSAYEHSISVFEIASHALMMKAQTPNPLWPIGISSDLKKVLIRAQDQDDHNLYLWDLQNQQIALTLATPLSIYFAGISPNNHYIAGSYLSRDIRIWDIHKWHSAIEGLSLRSKILLHQAFQAFQANQPLYLLDRREDIELIHIIDREFNNMITKTIQIIDNPSYFLNPDFEHVPSQAEPMEM